jgi:hypothetical protein
MKRFVLLLPLLLWFGFHGKAIDLSDSAQISLLTCSPGKELYSAFGHTGIRVTDYKNGFDVVFNYGTFDFDQPGFYTNFLKGKMRYMISTDRFDNFCDQYIYEQRRVEEQVLNLTVEEKQKIFAFLYWNAQPQNREYLYDFFWDNCATRPRDVFEKTLNGKLHYTYAGFDTTKTMRQTLKPYVAQMPWVDFGFDLILGLPCEIRATPRNQTFLPDRLQLLFEHATVNGQPFVTAHHVVVNLPFKPQPFKGVTPLMVTFVLLLLGLAANMWERFNNTHLWSFDVVLFFVAGLLGTFFLCMWLFTAHYSVPKNLNMLWLVPTHLFISFLLMRKNKPAWLQYYFAATFAFMVLLVITWKWNPQPYNLAALPLILLLANRALKIFIRFKQLSLQ